MVLLLIIVGLIAGVLSGLIGIGGGVLIVPALVYLFGLTQMQAQGTTLALLAFPVGILGMMTYFKNGYVDFKIVALIAVGFVVGGLLGSKLAINVPTELLRRVFGIFLLLIAVKMIFFK